MARRDAPTTQLAFMHSPSRIDGQAAGRIQPSLEASAHRYTSINYAPRAASTVGYLVGVAALPAVTPMATPAPVALIDNAGIAQSLIDNPSLATGSLNLQESGEASQDNPETLEAALHQLIENKGDDGLIAAYAERLCDDCFDAEAELPNAFYASEDPYYIAMDLRNNEGLDTNEIDSIDTLRDCRERFMEDKASWTNAAKAEIFDSIRNLVSSPPRDVSEGYADLRTKIDSFFVEEAYGLMQETIRAQFSPQSDSD